MKPFFIPTLSTLCSVLLAFNSIATPSLPAATASLRNPFAKLDEQRLDAARTSTAAYSAGQTRGSAAAKAKKHYLVQFRGDVPLGNIYDCIANDSYELLGASGDRLFRVDTDDIDAFKSSCGALLQSVKEDRLVKLEAAAAMPNDPDYDRQWAITDTKIDKAWNATRGSRSVKVAVIDSGFSRKSGDFAAGSVLSGYDLTANTASVSTDPSGHGTAVASIIGAAVNNGAGIAGALWNVTLVPYKVEDTDGNIYESTVISAIKMAADAGCDVINMSFGSYYDDGGFQSAVDYAVRKGCLLVSAAGNNGDPGDAESGKFSYPASCNGVVSVAAVDSVNRHASFSQHNSAVAVAAPGQDVLVDDPSKGAEPSRESGTSLAAPYVSAAAALARSVNRNIRCAEFAQLLKTTSSDLGAPGRDDYFGYGLLNAEKIVLAAAKPVVCGVEDGGVYSTARTVTVNEGSLTLNGRAFRSGGSVRAKGGYTLTVTKGAARRTLAFSIVSPAVALRGVAEGGIYNHSVNIDFSPGSATLNSLPYQSGDPVNADGSYTLRIRDSAGSLLLTRHFTVDTTPPKVQGVQEGGVYQVGARLSWNEGTAALDGSPVAGKNCLVSTEGSHSFTVTDTAGNTATVHFRVENVPSVKVLPMTARIAKWAQSGGYLFAIAPDAEELLVFKESDFSQVCSVRLDGTPTDVVSDGGTVYIALDAQHKIVLFSPSQMGVIRTISTISDPYVLAAGANGIYYAEKTEQCAIYRCGFDGTDAKLPIGTFFEPALAVDSTLHRLYIGESGTDGANLYAYDEAAGKVTAKSNYAGFGFAYPVRSVACENGTVFYAGCAFDAKLNTSAQLWVQNASSPAQGSLDAENGLLLAVTSGTVSVYDTATLRKIGAAPLPDVAIPAAEGNCLFYYGAETGTARCIRLPDGSVSAGNIAMLLPLAPVPDPAADFETTRSASGVTLSLPSALGGWVMDSSRHLLYATLPDENELLFLNASTLSVEYAENLCGRPTDLLLGDDGRLYVAIDGENAVAVYDGRTRVATLQTGFDPLKIAKDGDSLYFLTDENGGYSSLYRYSLSSGLTTKVVNSYFQNARLAVNRSAHILYIGETGANTCALSYFSTVKNTMVSANNLMENYGIVNADGGILFDGKLVYFAGLAFEPDTANVVHSYTGAVLAASDGLVVTPWDVFVRDTDDYASALPERAGLAQVGNGVLYTSPVSLSSITRTGEMGTLPKVTGVANGGVYANSVQISYDSSMAFLDGIYLPSGSVVHDTGKHTLVVLDGGASMTMDSFTIVPGMSSLVLNRSDCTLAVGDSASLSGYLMPSNTPGTPFWSSGNEKVVTVDADGTMHGVSPGTVTVTATCGSLTASCTVRVLIPATGVLLSQNNLYLTTGQTAIIAAAVLPATATGQGVNWSSSNPDVAAVDALGRVRAVGPGTAVVTATAADGLGASSKCTVVVTAG